MEKYTINNVKKDYIGAEIFGYIKKNYPNITSGNLNKLFRQKDVKVNGKWVPKNYKLELNDVINIYANKSILFNFTKPKFIYEDENVLIAFKPDRIESCNSTHTYSPTDYYFENIVREEKGQNLNICHRLDTNTKGMIIFSKNDKSHKELFDAFKNHLVHKTYLAIVYGIPKKDNEVLEGYLIRDLKNNYSKVSTSKQAGTVPVKTEYKLLKVFKDKNVCVLEITLHTGKTHQIRAHLKSIGLQIIGDPKYCSNEINKKFKTTSQMLYAYKYEFEFPKTSPLYYLNSKKLEININSITNI